MRRIAMREVVLLSLLALLTACGDPIMTLPGGELSGSVASPPADWSGVAGVKTIQVEFRPSDPYSHNIWGVGIGRDLYIATSGDGTRWTPFVAADPHVRARIDGQLYELLAAPVTDTDERARVAAAYVTKYDVDPDDNWVAEGLIYRLDRP
jgi:hypothetical protein